MAVLSEAISRLVQPPRTPVCELRAIRTAAEATAENLETALAVYGAARIEVETAKLAGGTAADLVAGLPQPAVTALLFAEAWNEYLVAAVEIGGFFAILELIFGGDGREPEFAGRDTLTPLEQEVARGLFAEIAVAAARAFEPVRATRIALSELVPAAGTLELGGPAAPVLALGLDLAAARRKATVTLLVPDAAFTPVRKALERPVVAKPTPSDPAWSGLMRKELNKTTVTLRTILDEQTLDLPDIADLAVGQMLPLAATAESRVRVEANGQPILLCRVGQANGAYTLRVEDFITPEKDFIDDLVAP